MICNHCTGCVSDFWSILVAQTTSYVDRSFVGEDIVVFSVVHHPGWLYSLTLLMKCSTQPHTFEQAKISSLNTLQGWDDVSEEIRYKRIRTHAMLKVAKELWEIDRQRDHYSDFRRTAAQGDATFKELRSTHQVDKAR